MNDAVDSIIYDNWIHLVMIRNSNDSKKGYFYINGIRYELASIPAIRNIATATNMLLGKTSTNNYPTKMYINDFRIYDHALSPREVKRISQGLVLHYPLNRQGWGQENLITNTIITNDPWKSAISGTTERDGKKGYIISNSSLYSKTSSGTTTIFPGLTYKTNTQYTLSWKWRDDYRTDGKSSSLYIRIKHTDGSVVQKISSKDYNYWKEEILTSTANKTIDMITTTYGNGGNLLITDMQLEEGAIKTSFSPFPESEEYTALGINDNIEYDISGFGNNGIKYDIFTHPSNVSKYNVSTYFNGTSSVIYSTTPRLGLVGDCEFTLAAWIYWDGDSWTNNIQGIVWNNNTSGNKGAILSTWNGRINLDFWGYRFYCSTQMSVKQWHHIAATKIPGIMSSSTCKLYVDGEEVSGSCSYDSDSFKNIYPNITENGINIGRLNAATGRWFKGMISDARVYTTALSAEDILSLYHNTAEIDSNNNIYGAIR